jgi:pimeloyl-ACP methyl ester carboxylesterase
MQKETTAKTESKNVKKSYELPAYITVSMQLLERLSSKLALKFALKLFFTPLSFTRPQREEKAHHSSAKESLKTQTGESFVLHQWGNQGVKVLLVHGWSGRGTQFFKLIEALRKNGYHVFAIDAPTHGDSPKKKQTNMLEFVNCIETVCLKHGPFTSAIGHSLGGAALLNALERNVDIPKLITLGTPSRISHVVRDFCEKVKASPKIGAAILSDIQKTFGVLISEVSPDHLAKKHNPSGLVIHDEIDADVDIEEAYILHQNWANSSLKVTSGLGHRKVLNDADVIADILAFIKA